MAVFFRIKMINMILHIEVKIFSILLKCNVDLKKKGSIQITTKNKKRVVRSKENNGAKIIAPDQQLCTFFKDSFRINASLKNNVILFNERSPKNSLIILFNLIKNTSGAENNKNLKKIGKNSILNDLRLDLEFLVKIHAKSIILYLYKILKTRRKNYGSNF